MNILKCLMKAQTHANIGVFLGLVGYVFFGWVGAILGFLFHVVPIADGWLRWKLRGEWMHTILGLLIGISLVGIIAPKYVWISLLSYGLHLFVDLFVDERLPYLWPISKQGYSFPLQNSEFYVNVMSAAGIVGMLLILIIR